MSKLQSPDFRPGLSSRCGFHDLAMVGFHANPIHWCISKNEVLNHIGNGSSFLPSFWRGYRVHRMNEEQREETREKYRFNPGGTRGGIGTFLFGLALTVAGAYLIAEHVRVSSDYWSWFGGNTFGLTLLPLLIGVGLLFFNAKSIAGWILSAGGALVIILGILTHLRIDYPATSLYNTLIMFVLFVAGLGLMARSLRQY